MRDWNWLMIGALLLCLTLWSAVLMFGATLAPRCGPDSPHGPRVGGILIEGCP